MNGGITRDKFWERLLQWHTKQGTTKYSDDCLLAMEATEKEMGLDTPPLDQFKLATTLYNPLRVVTPPPEVPKKKSVFGKIKENNV